MAADDEFLPIRRPRSTTRKRADTPRTSVLEGAQCLFRGGGIHEIRILRRDGFVAAGYFETPELAADALARRNGDLADARIYVTLNPVQSALLARAKNHLGKPRKLTTDGDIARRVWFPIDVDPVRPPDQSATKAEVVAARRKCDEVVRFLQGEGWPFPVRAMSGNGAHALFAIDQPNTPAVTAAIQKALKTLDARFSDDTAKVDTTVGNASRIWKLYGTRARKGAGTTERPHRRAVLESVPSSLLPVPIERIRRLAAAATVATGALPAGEWPLLTMLKTRGLYRNEKLPGQHRITCPWQDEHTTDGGVGETMLFDPSPENGNHGGFKCFHDHCAARTIDDVRAAVLPDVVQLRRMADIAPEQVDFLWWPYLPLGKLTLVEGDPGLGKSQFTLALASTLSRGQSFPGDPTPSWVKGAGNTLLLSAEDGLADTVRPRLDALGADVSRVFVLDGGFVLDEVGRAYLDRALTDTTARLVIIDPLVAYLGAGVDLHRAYITRLRDGGSNFIAAPIAHSFTVLSLIETSGIRDKNGQADLYFAIKSANGKGYTVYLSEGEEEGPYGVHGEVNYNELGAHIKGLTNGKTYWAYVVYSENGVAVARSRPVQLNPTK